MKQLNLTQNKIHTILSEALDGLESLVELSLGSNNLTILRSHSFTSLTELQLLYLWNNEIKKIEPNSLPYNNLHTVILDNNQLSSLSWTIFGTEHPSQLEITLDHNPLVCNNQSLCWIAQGERQGWITWRTVAHCKDTNTNWNAVKFNCTHLGLFTSLVFQVCKKWNFFYNFNNGLGLAKKTRTSLHATGLKFGTCIKHHHTYIEQGSKSR